MKNRIGLMLVLMLLVFSCKKASERKCWKGSGSKASKTIQLMAFDKLTLREHLKYVLIQDSTFEIEIDGYSNLNDLISCEIVDGMLTIHNLNKCNFLRYKKSDITVKIHCANLSEIVFMGSDSLTNEGVFQLDFMKVSLNEGGGSMKLKVQGNGMNVENPHGWGDITLEGNLNNLRLDMDGDGYFDTRNLQVNSELAIMTKTSSLCKVNGEGSTMKVEINNTGDIWYYGTPTVLFTRLYGTGKLIQK